MGHRIVTEYDPKPAAGADFVFTTSDGDRMRLVLVNAQLVSSSSAANRLHELSWIDQAGILLYAAGVPYPAGRERDRP